MLKSCEPGDESGDVWLSKSGEQVYARDATTISPYALLLFGGALRVEHAARRIVVDEWLSIDASPRTAVLVKQVLPSPLTCPITSHLP